MRFQEDLTVFFKDFSEPAIFSRNNSQILTANVLFDSVPKELSEYDRSFYDEKFYGSKVSSNDILLTGLESDLTVIRFNDAVNVKAENYFCLLVTIDGSGIGFVHISKNKG
jgi:hypothetical protein